jgi:hypothetical protein
VDGNATLQAYGNAISGNTHCGIGFGEGNNTVRVANLDFSGGNGGANICGPYSSEASLHYPPGAIDIGYVPEQSYALGYIPSDPALDRYLYVYPDDETRRIVNKIGTGLGLTWSVAWHDGHVWAATLWGTIYKLDPQSGAVVASFTLAGASQPWGMTFDDQGYMWVVDFAERKLFQVDAVSGAVVNTFSTPNPDAGGCKGVAWDGQYLNIMGWVTSEIYRVDRTGKLIETVPLDSGGRGGLAWDGSHFWVPHGGRIIKYDRQGREVGWIYAASEGTWDLGWDGEFMWATQRTNENWMDAKIYQLQILDDHDHRVYMPLMQR